MVRAVPILKFDMLLSKPMKLILYRQSTGIGDYIGRIEVHIYTRQCTRNVNRGKMINSCRKPQYSEILYAKTLRASIRTV